MYVDINTNNRQQEMTLDADNNSTPTMHVALTHKYINTLKAILCIK